ncbi:DUF1622 domain-containing protein [Mucilaginibacter sp. HC2]|jgi:uncharacterized membrane protein|uniref:DUF1622 domain-containing protein n=1 Tax=Mucilaginibacter inviolabilis TaxID=2714892 RepID=UPI001409D4DB|nr:DUF1622 domain-containing protein [Mucilaginibacter inviolabilis]NHA04683.1 DUF1622 domain-containing protein [Mucilaginibacter inviolabilis]
MSSVLESISRIISYCSIAIICYGAALGLLKFIRNELKRFQNSFSLAKTVQIKIEVGYYLLLGLEFLIASDIIDTILNPSFNDLGILAGTVFIRTSLSFFLNKEIENVADNKPPKETK